MSERFRIMVALFMFAAVLWSGDARASTFAPFDDTLAAGYPAGVTVTCDPAIPAADFGLTTFPVGSMPTVQLAPTICLGDFLFDAPAGYLAQVRYLNPTLNVDWTIGVGVLVTVHEAQHAHGWYSETQAECRAMQIVSKLLAGRPGPLAMAELYDSRLPAAYHDGSTCSLESL